MVKHTASFSDTPSDDKIGKASVKGGVITLAAQLFKFVIQTSGIFFLSRLLSPDDLGLFAMVTAITAFIAVFREMGLSAATIQEKTISHEQINSLFWLNTAVGLLIAFILAVAAPYIAHFFGRSEIKALAIVSAVSFFLSAICVQHQALLSRAMNFGQLALTDIIPVAVSNIVGIILAFRGYGYRSLAIMQITAAVFVVLTTWTISKWRPSIPKWDASANKLVGFGAQLTGFNFLNYFSRNLDNILIGKYWGAAPLGIYSRAYQLLVLPLSQVNGPFSSVAVPALSRLNQFPDRYRRAYIKIVQKLLFITIPLIGMMAGASDTIIHIALGPGWEAAGPIFRVLALVGIVQPLGSSTGWLFISQGRGQDMLKWGVISSILTAVSFLVGIRWGTMGVALSYSLSGLVIRTPLLFWYVGRSGLVSTKDLYSTLSIPMFLGAVLFAFNLGVQMFAANDSLFLKVLIHAVGSCLILLALSYVFPSTRTFFKEGVEMLRKKGLSAR